MKLHYYEETDSLYIDLIDKPGTKSKEVAPGVVLDFDADGHLVGIDVDHASDKGRFVNRPYNKTLAGHMTNRR